MSDLNLEMTDDQWVQQSAPGRQARIQEFDKEGKRFHPLARPETSSFLDRLVLKAKQRDLLRRRDIDGEELDADEHALLSAMDKGLYASVLGELRDDKQRLEKKAQEREAQEQQALEQQRREERARAQADATHGGIVGEFLSEWGSGLSRAPAAATSPPSSPPLSSRRRRGRRGRRKATNGGKKRKSRKRKSRKRKSRKRKSRK